MNFNEREIKMFFTYIYELRLVNQNGQAIKTLYCIPKGLENFKPIEDRKQNCIFLTLWAEDRKKELLKLLGKNKGCFNLFCLSTETGNTIAGSGYISLI